MCNCHIVEASLEEGEDTIEGEVPAELDLVKPTGGWKPSDMASMPNLAAFWLVVDF